MKNNSIISKEILLQSTCDAIKGLRVSNQIKNPVMFVTYIGAITTTIYLASEIFNGQLSWFNVQIALWLWFTVLFANFAEAIAESRGKAQAASLRRTQVEAHAIKIEEGKEIKAPSSKLKKGDVILCKAMELIPCDGEVIEGAATVDESAITGESAPVIRESGGDRSAVTAGTKVLSDTLKIRVTSDAGHSFLDKMISLIEGAKRQRTPNEIALHMVLSGLTIIFLLTTVAIKGFSYFSESQLEKTASTVITIPILVSLLVCLIPTTISALLSAVGIAGMDRLVQRNVIATSGRSVEAAGDIDLLIIDKTGTITIGNRMAKAFLPAPGYDERELAKISQLASLADETPEGRSIVILAKSLFGMRAESLNAVNSTSVPFSAKTRMSGLDFQGADGSIARSIRKGATSAIKEHVKSIGGSYPLELDQVITSIAKEGGTPLLVSENKAIIGVIHLKDIVKGGVKEKFKEMREMGIRTLMITGDNALTAAAIAAEAGVDDYIADATPEMKLDRIKKEQSLGRLVAMTGDGTNDAPALAQADVGVAMNTGTQASREAGNMVDLDSNPTKLIDIVKIGKQLLMTRGALTTFSIANDVAKYFAIIPAIFSHLHSINGDQSGPIAVLNIMHLASPQTAILSAVIVNALTIVALIPLALKGVKYRAASGNSILFDNIVIYGFGGIVAPFFAIKLVDLLLNAIL